MSTNDLFVHTVEDIYASGVEDSRLPEALEATYRLLRHATYPSGPNAWYPITARIGNHATGLTPVEKHLTSLGDY